MNTGMNRYESTLHLSQGMTEKVITSRGKLKAQVSSLKWDNNKLMPIIICANEKMCKKKWIIKWKKV